MQHSFNVELAKKIGILDAILLQSIYYWIEKNKANNKHFYDGEYWTYNSQKAFADMFPYATERKIQLALERLKEKDLIKCGNYNKFSSDRTIWYAITQNGKCILQNVESDTDKMLNEVQQNVGPIPDINQIYNITPIIPLGDKKKENESEVTSKNKKIIEDVIDYLNEKGETSFKTTNKRTISLINARIRQGYQLDDFKDVIWYCYCEWVQKPFKFKNGKMSDTYFRPSTLFNETNFENYLQEYRKKNRDEL